LELQIYPAGLSVQYVSKPRYVELGYSYHRRAFQVCEASAPADESRSMSTAPIGTARVSIHRRLQCPPGAYGWMARVLSLMWPARCLKSKHVSIRHGDVSIYHIPCLGGASGFAIKPYRFLVLVSGQAGRCGSSCGAVCMVSVASIPRRFPALTASGSLPLV